MTATEFKNGLKEIKESIKKELADIEEFLFVHRVIQDSFQKMPQIVAELEKPINFHDLDGEKQRLDAIKKLIDNLPGFKLLAFNA